MSYDIDLEKPLCVACSELDEPSRIDWNYTANVACMWRKAMPETEGLAGFDGMIAKDALSHLRRGIEAMEDDPSTYIEMEPGNKWGSYAGQLKQLRHLRNALEENPTARIRVSR